MKKRVLFLSFLTVFILVAFTGCIPGDGTYTVSKPAGFFWGIWHGWVAPFSLIISLFKHNIRIYESVNNGWWYDFGFYIAIISGFGSISLFRKNKRKNDK